MFLKSELKKSEHNKSVESKKPIRIYLDFDGTLTKSDGMSTVNSVFYKSLFIAPEQVTIGNYADLPLKNEKEISELINKEFKEKNGSQHSSLQIQESLIRFLNSALEIDADIVIISKNRKEYIKAMLRLAGFSEQSITKLTIYDVNACGGVKYDRVMEHESKATYFPAAGVVIADDSEGDFNQMLSAVKNIGEDKTRVYPDEIIIAKHFKAGELNGDELVEEIQLLEKGSESIIATGLQ